MTLSDNNSGPALDGQQPRISSQNPSPSLHFPEPTFPGSHGADSQAIGNLVPPSSLPLALEADTPPPYTPTPSDSIGSRPNPTHASSSFRSPQPRPAPSRDQSNSSRTHPIASRPIMLPQRRPGDVHRGFALAYPPVLASVDIDPPAWFEFLETFNKLLEVGTGVRVLQGGAAAIRYFPLLFAGRIISNVGKYAAWKAGASDAVANADTFIDDANESFFRPRGLVAGVIKFQDLASSGPLPTPAELIYQEEADRGIGGIGSWMDRRAQDKFEEEVHMVGPTSNGLIGGRAVSLLRGDGRNQRSAQVLAPPVPYELPPVASSSSPSPAVEVPWHGGDKKEKMPEPRSPVSPPTDGDSAKEMRADKDQHDEEAHVPKEDLGNWAKNWTRKDARRQRGKGRDEPMSSAKKLQDYLYLYITVASEDERIY